MLINAQGNKIVNRKEMYALFHAESAKSRISYLSIFGCVYYIYKLMASIVAFLYIFAPGYNLIDSKAGCACSRIMLNFRFKRDLTQIPVCLVILIEIYQAFLHIKVEVVSASIIHMYSLKPPIAIRAYLMNIHSNRQKLINIFS